MSIIGYTHVAMEIWGGIFCLIIVLSLRMGEVKHIKRNHLFLILQLSNTVLLFADAFAWIFRGHSGELSRMIVSVSNFIVFVLGYVMLVLYTEFLVTYIGQDTKQKKLWYRGIVFFAVLGIALVILTQFNHMLYSIDASNVYHRGKWFFLSQGIGILGALANTVMLCKHKGLFQKKVFYATISYLILPFLAMIVQLFIYGISLLNISITASLLWMYFVQQTERERERARQAAMLIEQERKLNDMRINIVISQIQPHFLYNTLNTIYYLCDQDPQKAQKAVSEFSGFLRGNLDFQNRNKPILFEEELAHLKIYLELEKMRFDERLQIEYEIETVDFKLPALSVQPLAENAVKYGIAKKEEGGTVKIITKENATEYKIMVIDEGMGFDPLETKNDGRVHIGIDNVRTRLEIMCHGKLEINSVIGKGTTATIILPK